MSKCWPLQMPPTAKAVLISLADNANDHGYCWPSISTIAQRTCFSERAIQGAIKWLEATGAVKADRSNGRHTTYVVTPENYKEPAQDMHPAGDAPPQQVRQPPAGDAPVPPQEMRQPPQEMPTNRQEPSKQPSRNRQKGVTTEYPDDFERAWSIYPRHAGSSKKDTFKAWNARIKQGATVGEMIDSSRRYAAYVTALKTEERYIKQPETFFGPSEHFRTAWTIPKSAETPEQREERIRREFLGDGTSGDDGMTIEMEG